MHIRKLLRPLLVVAACLGATTAFAITPISDAERSATRQQITAELGQL